MRISLSIVAAFLCVFGIAQSPGQPRPSGPGSPIPVPNVIEQMHAPEVSKDWVETKHVWRGATASIPYTATCGFVPIKNDLTEETEAEMFFVAYTKDAATPSTRPVVFAFNGGPGSSSIWLHVGALGPRRAKMNDDGSLPAPPFEIVDNQESWLPYADVVMVDAVGTGYSRTTKPEFDHNFYGLQQDLAAFTNFIRQYLSEAQRWRSPVFVAGESYGGFRVAGLAQTLLSEGIAVNGIISISGVMNFGTIDFQKDNDLPFISFLPAECATAIYHHKVSSADFNQTVKECEAFASGEYAAALMKGNGLTSAERKQVAAKISSFIGVSPLYVERSNLRVTAAGFRTELLRDTGDIVGRYDARLIGHNSSGVSQTADYDPSNAAVTPVFVSAFNDYIASELNFHTSEKYRSATFREIPSWDFGNDGETPDTSELLRRAMEQNPHMKVMLCCSWYDLACPYFGMRYVMDHLGEQEKLKKNIRFRYFKAGHMVYIDTPSRMKFAQDVGEFIHDATGPGR